MVGLLVKNVDALTENFLGLAGQEAFDFFQRLDAGGIDVVDGERIDVAGHDVHRHRVQHLFEREEILSVGDRTDRRDGCVQFDDLCSVPFKSEHERFLSRGGGGAIWPEFRYPVACVCFVLQMHLRPLLFKNT